MNRIPHLARLLAPMALLSSVAAATPLAQAHAASAPQPSAAAPQSASPHMPSPDLSITICINDHCVTIKF